MRKLFDRWLSNTPWWLVSAGLHAVLLLGATLVCMDRLLALDGVELLVVPRSSRTEELIDYPRDIIERRSFIPPDDELPNLPENPFLAFDLGVDTMQPEEPGGEAPLKPFEVTSSALFGPEAASKLRRLPEARATNILRAGIGDGYGQRSQNGSLRRSLHRISGCCIQLTESAVIAGLRWLARHQNPDGSWSAGAPGGSCTCTGGGDGAYDVGVTGLSLLAFLGAGFSPLSKDEYSDPVDPGRMLRFGEVVKKGVQWLTAHQDPDGCVGARGPKHLYNHAIASLALSEAYGMTAADPLHVPAQKAIDFLVAAQNPGKGWRYSSRSGDNDTSVTGWAVMALKSAQLSELAFPNSAVQGALAWLDEATDKSSPRRTGYTQAGTGKVYVPGRNEQFDDHPTMSAVSVLARMLIRRSKQDPAMEAVMDLSMDLPQWEPGKVDFYYWYYGSLAMYQYDGPSGGLWSRWNEPMKHALVPSQKLRKDGCQNGSWDPAEDRWGFEGGRVYATAINCMTLEVYYRYAHVFGTK